MAFTVEEIKHALVAEDPNWADPANEGSLDASARAILEDIEDAVQQIFDDYS